MKSGVPWNVRGVRAQTREAAREAARRAGMSVSEWLESTIIERAAEEGVEPEDYRSAAGEHFVAIADRLANAIERIDRRLDQLADRPPARPVSGPEAYAPRGYWRPPPPAPEWMPPPHARGPEWPPSPAPAINWGTSIDEAVAEINARQQALEADPDAAPPAFLSTPPPSHQATTHVAPQPQQLAPELPPPPQHAPRSQRAAEPMPRGAPWPQQDLSGLETQLRKITEQIQALHQPSAVEQAVMALRQDLAEIGQSLTKAMPRNVLDAMEHEMRRLGERIDQTKQSGVEPATIAGVERALNEVRDAVRTLTPAEGLVGFSEAVQQLSHKIDSMVGGPDPSSLQQLEAAISALRSITSTVASNDALSRLVDEIRGLSAKVDRLEAEAASKPILAPGLESQLRAFTEQLQLLQQTQGNPAAFGQLQERIASLAAKLDQSDARLTHLDAIEKGLNDLMAHLAELRGSAGATLQHPPADKPGVDALKRDLSRTQESLEAVHGTIDRVVDRLAMIETDIRAAPTAPQPAPATVVASPAPAAAPSPGELPTAPAEMPTPRPVAVNPVPERGHTRQMPPQPREHRPIDPNLPPDFPLEPGSGAPRPSVSAADRIAASEAALGGAKPTPLGKTNFIAAARRAAQAAELSAPGPEQRPAPDDRGSPRPSIGQRFRKLLAGSGIVLIVAGAVHLGINVYESYAPSGVSNAALLSRQESKPEEKKMARAENRGAVAPVKPLTADPQTTASIAAPRAAAPAAAPSPEPILVPSDKFPQALRSAALSGDAVAAYEIAMRHLDGRGVPVSVEEAARWFQRAAKAGLAPAQFWLGSLYEKGQGVKRNTEAARGLYVAAAEKGNAKAMHNLAVLYAEGGLGKPDYATAAEWFRKAAEHGVADSQYNLGILYARGVGVEQNLSESYKWFALAAATGDKDAGKKRDEIGKRLDPAALSAARQAADSFVAKRQPAEATTVQPPPGGWDAPTANARTPKGAQAVIVNRS